MSVVPFGRIVHQKVNRLFNSMLELRTEPNIPRRILKQNSIGNLKNRVQEIIKDNQKVDDLMIIWQECLLENRQEQTMEAIVDEYNHKQRQLLTLGRLTMQAIEFIELELLRNQETVVEDTVLLEALRIGIADRDRKIRQCTDEIAALKGRLSQLQDKLIALTLTQYKLQHPEEMSTNSLREIIDNEQSIMKKCLEDTLQCLSNKQMEVNQQDNVNNHILKLLEDQCEKRISLQHSFRIMQNNFNLMVAENTQLKKQIENLNQQVRDFRKPSPILQGKALSNVTTNNEGPLSLGGQTPCKKKIIVPTLLLNPRDLEKLQHQALENPSSSRSRIISRRHQDEPQSSARFFTTNDLDNSIEEIRAIRQSRKKEHSSLEKQRKMAQSSRWKMQVQSPTTLQEERQQSMFQFVRKWVVNKVVKQRLKKKKSMNHE